MPTKTQSPSKEPPAAKRAWVFTTQALHKSTWQKGLFWAIISPLFLGTIPIFAKIAYATGAEVLTVITLRTLFAAIVLWLGVILFRPIYIQTSTPALLSSLLAGGINGIGSLFFYASLNRIDASLGQLINITYLIFVTLMLRLLGQTISKLTVLRTFLAIFAIYLLSVGGISHPDWTGIGMMLIAAIAYAIQMVLSQRITFDIPAPTMTLYAMTAMATVVSVAWLIQPTAISALSPAGWRAILWMGVFTALSRLTLFLGVKSLGSMQTALLGVLEVVVSIGLAIFFLGERLTLVQWGGTAVLLSSVLLVRYERNLASYDWWHTIINWRIYKKQSRK